MHKQEISKKEVDNSINLTTSTVKEEQIEENIGYNCPECSSLVEILSINEYNLEFKCVEKDEHSNILNINNYLEKMKKYINNKNLKDKCEKHNNKYISYCLDCKSHLCKECLKINIHKKHNKILIEEEQPNEEDINIIKEKIKYYTNKIENRKYKRK